MKIYVTPSYSSKLRKLTKNDPRLTAKVKKRIALFSQDQKYPGLKLHKLLGGMHDSWSFSITADIRIIIVYRYGDVVLVDIGKHDDVY